MSAAVITKSDLFGDVLAEVCPCNGTILPGVFFPRQEKSAATDTEPFLPKDLPFNPIFGVL